MEYDGQLYLLAHDPGPSGGSRLRLRPSCLEEIEQYVLSWGIHPTVIEPAGLRQRLLNPTQGLWQRYRADPVFGPQQKAP